MSDRPIDQFTHEIALGPSNGGSKQDSQLSAESRSKLLRWFNGNPFDRRSDVINHALRAMAWCEMNSGIYHLSPELREGTLRDGARALGLSLGRLSRLIITAEKPLEERKEPFLIAFEGIDGAGKTCQIGMLESYLRDSATSVTACSCPNYRGFFGREIAALLSGNDAVDAANLDPKSMALWYALDRKRLVSDLDLNGTSSFILFNRYTLSNAVYQSARSGLDITSWVFQMEHTYLEIPCPDLYIVFDVSPDVSHSNMSQRKRSEGTGTGLDVYEKSRSLLEAARKRYVALADEFPWIELIDCTEADQTMRSAESIHEEVRARLARHHLIHSK